MEGHRHFSCSFPSSFLSLFSCPFPCGAILLFVQVRQLYDLYSFHLIPTMGEVVAQDRHSYQVSDGGRGGVRPVCLSVCVCMLQASSPFQNVFFVRVCPRISGYLMCVGFVGVLLFMTICRIALVGFPACLSAFACFALLIPLHFCFLPSSSTSSSSSSSSSFPVRSTWSNRFANFLAKTSWLCA